MARKNTALEFRRPRRKCVAVRRRQSKFRPGGLPSRAHGLHSVLPMLRYWMAITLLVPVLVLAGVTFLR